MEREAKCSFCGRTVTPASGGITLLEHRICSFCESKIVTTSVEEDQYLVFKEKIKRIWFY